MNTRTILLPLTAALLLAACGQQNSQDAQIAENAKQIEILRQQAEIQKLQNELSAQAASAEQVYQLTASAVAQTIPAAAQAAYRAPMGSNICMTAIRATGCFTASSAPRPAIWRPMP